MTLSSLNESSTPSNQLTGPVKPNGLENGSGGLGFYDPTSPIITLNLDLSPQPSTSSGSNVSNGSDGGVMGPEKVVSPLARNGRSRKKTSKKVEMKEDVREVQLVQDLGALKSRKGDTGMSWLLSPWSDS